ncbi:MAG: hypothetical protein ABSA97_03365 [Verrucomicrobiia bacterium]
MRTKAIVVPLLTGLAVALVAYAQESKSADGIFNFSTAKMTSYKTWSGDIVQTMNMFGSEVATKGSITQKQPRKMRMQTDMPMMGQQMKMVLGDDGIMWQEMEMPGGKQVIKMDMAKVLSNAMAQTGIKVDPLKAMDPSQQWAANKEMMDFVAKGTAISTANRCTSSRVLGNKTPSPISRLRQWRVSSARRSFASARRTVSCTGTNNMRKPAPT